MANPGEWWARLGGAGTHALRKLPAARPRAEPAYWATVREIHQRAATLIGRHEELAEIASFATGSAGYRWLAGGAWAGKTSLLAEAVTVLQDECDVICYFLSRREADADSSHFLAAVVPQLAYLLEEDPPVAELYQFRALWQRAVQRAEAEDRHLVLVVDGLDEDLRPPGLPSVPSVLPPVAGGRAHVLVSSRPLAELPEDLPPGHPLAETQPVQIEPFEGGPELAELARQEIAGLVRHPGRLAIHMLGLLAAAAGPLAVGDLIRLSRLLDAPAADGPAPPMAELSLDDVIDADRFLAEDAARSLQQVGRCEDTERRRYQYAHGSLLEYAQKDRYLGDRRFRDAIHRWARSWSEADWPVIVDDPAARVPDYLLANYPSTLAHDPQRLAALVSDIGWAEAAIPSVGVDLVLADLRRAAAAAPASATVAAMVAVVSGQARYLRPPQPVDQPGYVLRQLCMQAGELSEKHLADELRRRIQSRPGPCLAPLWTTRRASRALSAELFLTEGGVVSAVAALPGGQVVIGQGDGRVLAWDPAVPGVGPAELGRHSASPVYVVAALPGGQVVTGAHDGRVLVWDPAAPGAHPAVVGSYDRPVKAVAVLPGGRVVIGGGDGRVLVWDPAVPGVGPAELGRHSASQVLAVAVLPGGRVVTAGEEGRVLVWDPAAPGADPVELGGYHWGGARALAVLPGGRLVTGEADRRVLVWDPAVPGADPAELGGQRQSGPVQALAVLPGGRVVTGEYDGRVLVWDPGAPDAGPAELGRHNASVFAVAVLPGGQVVSGGGDARVLVWDPAAPGADLADQDRYAGDVGAVAVLPGGQVVTGRVDGLVQIWDATAPGAVPIELGRQASGVHTAAVLPGGRVITAGFNGRVLAWDPAAPDADPAQLGPDWPAAREVAVLPDGRLVTGEYDGLLVWDPATPGADPARLSVRGSLLAVLPGGQVVTSDASGSLLVWDLDAPGADPARLSVRGGLLAVLPCGQVVTSDASGSLLVWDLDTPGAGPVELGRHDNPVQAAAVLPGGQVVTGGEDVRIWDPAAAETNIVQLGCSASALAAAPLDAHTSCLAIAHHGTGFSTWSFRM